MQASTDTIQNRRDAGDLIILFNDYGLSVFSLSVDTVMTSDLSNRLFESESAMIASSHHGIRQASLDLVSYLSEISGYTGFHAREVTSTFP